MQQRRFGDITNHQLGSLHSVTNCSADMCEQAAPSLESLRAAVRTFDAERANLIARTQHADLLISAALSQLEHRQEGGAAALGPPAAGCVGSRAGGGLDAVQLRQRDAALARRLRSAMDASQVLKEQIALQTMQQQQLYHADASPEKAGHRAAHLAGLVAELSSEAAVLAEEAQSSVLLPPPPPLQQQQHPAAVPGEAPRLGLEAGPQHPRLQAIAAAAAAAMAPLPASPAVDVRRPATPAPPPLPQQHPPQYHPALASHHQCFSLGVDWSAVPLQQRAPARQAFQPGTSVRDFACPRPEEEASAYITVQNGQRDGKRQRVPSGMLAQCLRRPPSALPAPASLPAPVAPVARRGTSGLTATLGAPERPLAAQQQPQGMATGGGPVAWRPLSGAAEPIAEEVLEGEFGRGWSDSLKQSVAAALMPEPCSFPEAPPSSLVAEALPSPSLSGSVLLGSTLPSPSGLPSRTPKRKRSERSNDDELAAAFELLDTSEQGSTAGQPTQGALAGSSSRLWGQQQEQLQGQGQVGGQPEWDTFLLFDEVWHGGRDGQRRTALKRPQQQQAQARGRPGRKTSAKKVGGCVIS